MCGRHASFPSFLAKGEAKNQRIMSAFFFFLRKKNASSVIALKLKEAFCTNTRIFCFSQPIDSVRVPLWIEYRTYTRITAGDGSYTPRDYA